MAAMEASRREMMTSQEPEVEEEEEDKKAKRKREEDEPESHKKHPNQYTYRPKPPSFAAPPAAASPRKTAGTPVPTAPAHEHGTRRAEKIANGIKEQPFTAVSVSNLSFHLPDHLLAHSDLLSTSPVPLEVRSPRTMAFLPRNHFINQRYGPFTEDRDDDDNLLLPDEPPVREPTGEPGTHQEPPTRIRYPAKRITTGEVRKRVRHVLEYVGRVQQDEAKRHERAKLIGIDIKPLSKHDNELEPLDDVLKGPTSAQLLDELTRDLITFQESFVQGMFASPLPPSVAAFNTPTLPSLGFVSAREDTDGGAERQDGNQVENGEESQDREEALNRNVELEHVEKGDEVDVYREGMVGVIITEPEEEQAAERIEEAALSGV
ncbi:hypothetical protein BCR39DRAFT_325129 [Naematelia encephala]|uniref:Uncharacterized protein n=1 Tax=Naematelia encephala TaxID=71784 RepID=A0A1Y2AP05_9TREE|nr:hypothetical protein BCR39DRAFT_325129 [Naematelia encephala]